MSSLYRRLVSGSCEIQSSVYSVQLAVILAKCWLMQLLKLHEEFAREVDFAR